MASNDRLTQFQEKLVKQISESHRVFLLHFYGAILNLLLFSIFTFLLGLYLASESWEIPIYCFPSLVILVAILRKMGRIPSLMRASRNALKGIEKPSDDTQLQTGIANYINQVASSIWILVYPEGDTRNLSLNSNQMESNQFILEFIVYGFVIIITSSIMYFIYPDTLTQLDIVIGMGLFVAITVFRFFIYLNWVNTINRWLKAYHALLIWEEKIASEDTNWGEKDVTPREN
jgi:hypothetical protein